MQILSSSKMVYKPSQAFSVHIYIVGNECRAVKT